MKKNAKNETKNKEAKNKALTGYPSIDRPQEKYYRKTPIREIETKQRIYDLIFRSNKENMDAPALQYMGKRLSFAEVKELTDAFAEGLVSLGVMEKDVVLVGLPHCPEAVVSLLAVNRIGAATKWFDIRAGEQDIAGYINSSKCRYLIITDILISKVTEILQSVCTEKIIVVGQSENSRFIEFSHVMEMKAEKLPEIAFNAERPAVMVQSSGTTGTPKTIVHSNISIAASVRKIAYSDLPLGRGTTLLALLPPWIAYGLGQSVIMQIALGGSVLLSPSFDPSSLQNNIGEFTTAFAAPFHYRYVKEHWKELTESQKGKLHKTECLVSGGDKISDEENKEMEELFGSVLINGYGSNEAWGVLCVNPAQCNKYGTVGIACYDETIIAYDNDKEEELKYGEVGEICALCNSLFRGYENNEEETAKVKKRHKDGKVWLHTGDLGYIDEEGYVTLLGRLRRVIVRNAFKIAAATIENAVCGHPYVKECVAVEVPDKEEEHAPMAFVTLSEAASGKAEEEIKAAILQKCERELKAYEVPKYLEILPELPYTQNGKYDFRRLEELGKEKQQSMASL